jgi:hypothetical protein
VLEFRRYVPGHVELIIGEKISVIVAPEVPSWRRKSPS